MAIANYNEASISGASWTRCWQVLCENPLGGSPRVVMHEEDVFVASGGGTITRCRPMPLVVEFDASGSFPLLDPATGDATGSSMSHAALFAALYSLYMQAATARDEEAGP